MIFRILYIILLIIPSLAIGQSTYQDFSQEFNFLTTRNLDDVFVKQVYEKLDDLESLDTSIVNQYMPYEYKTRGSYTTHDFFKFFAIGKVNLHKERELLVYVRRGGAGGKNMFVLAILIKGNEYCNHFEIAGWHGDGGFERLITAKIEEDQILVNRKDFKRINYESLELENETQNAINITDCL